MKEETFLIIEISIVGILGRDFSTVCARLVSVETISYVASACSPCLQDLFFLVIILYPAQ